MGKKQKIGLLVYIIAVILIVIYPPYNLEVQGHIVASKYSWIWEPISFADGNIFGLIDPVKLCAELIGISLIAGAFIILTMEKK